MAFVSHLESALDGTRLDAGRPATTHAGRPLWVRYDLAAVGRAVTREELARRPASLWRWRELLPVVERAHEVSLGETSTPLVECPRLAERVGLERLWIKDESRLPTGSFKARGMALAVSMALELGVRHLAIPTAGNAGGALAAYAARAGLECTVVMPADTPLVNRLEPALFGARAFTLDGLIHDCGALVREACERFGWFDVSTLKEPYRIEGKKTMGLELALQLDWELPDAIVYPTGGGTGLIGMSKAFAELSELGWLESDVRPRFYACQSDGCAPIVRAFDAGERFAAEHEGAHTAAAGLRVPRALGDFMILDAVRASGGAALACPEGELREWTLAGARLSGLSLCPETGVCLGALARAVAQGRVGRGERVVVFNTGAAQKYVELLAAEPQPLERARPDWGLLGDLGAGRGAAPAVK
jgi:threonine synthase